MAAVSTSADVVGDVMAWVGSSDAASGGMALAGTLAACLVIALVMSLRRRSRW